MKSEKGFIGIVLIIIGIALILMIIGVIGISIYEEVSFGEKEGIIIDKYYKQAYTTTSMMMCGKVMIPRIIHHPETWNFKIEKEIDGEKKSITITVSEDIYNKYNIGEYFKKE